MMENLEDYQLFSIEMEENETEDETLARFTQHELGSNRVKRFLATFMPRRLVIVIVVTAIFLARYYADNCIPGRDGHGNVSKPMYLPMDVSFNPIKFIFAALEEHVGKPFWSMPEGHGSS